MSSSPEEIVAAVDASSRALAEAFGPPPAIALALGSGLGPLTDQLQGARSVPYAALGLPSTGVEGHAGAAHVGELNGVRVLLLAGRVHLYEGRPVDEVVRAVRAVARWGVREVVLTSAVGALDPSMAPGDIVVLTDHVNLTGRNPLTGPNLDALGPRFPDLGRAYDPALRARALRCAEALGLPLREGVYAAMLGPSYETPAEIRMLQALGATVVGMSMVPEIVALAHMGRPALGLCMVSNLAAGILDEPLRHEDVTLRVGEALTRLAPLLRAFVAEGGP